MNLRASLRIAVTSLLANKGRSLLTMLGVIIGVAAVIIVVAIGEGLKADTLSRIQSLGTNMLYVGPQRSSRLAGRAAGKLELEHVEMIRQEGEGIAYVAPDLNRTEQIKYRNLTHSSRVTATTPEYAEIRNMKIEEGRFITDADNRARKRVAVIGATLVEELFYGRPQIGATIKVKGISFEVVGILESKGSGGFFNQDDTVVIPFFTGQGRLWGGDALSAIQVSAASADESEVAKESLTSILRREHHLREGDEDDFRIRDQTEFLTTMNETADMMTKFLGGIAFVSLLVGGVGIMNIMLVSVTERTREIGTRKAVGARPRDIMTQFLIESVMLSVLGGIIGAAIGITTADAVGSALGWSTSVSVSAILLAFGFSAAVGIFFGLYPAGKASKLDPIDALRYE